MAVSIHRGDPVVAAAPGVGAVPAGGGQRDGLISHRHGELRPGRAQIGDGQGLRQGGGVSRLPRGRPGLLAAGLPRQFAVLRHGHIVPLFRKRCVRVRRLRRHILHRRRLLLREQPVRDLVAEEQVYQQPRHDEDQHHQDGAEQIGLAAAGRPPAAPAGGPPADLAAALQRLFLLAEGALLVGVGIFLPADGALLHGHRSPSSDHFSQFT